MFEKKTNVYLTNDEKRLLTSKSNWFDFDVYISIIELNNELIQQGRYTDCVDELIYKIASAKVRKVRVQAR